jgi:hypothetical protein
VADLILKQVVSVLDDRTTMICVDAAGQIRPVKLPFDTIAGSFDQPPFHVHCRSISVPWATGMVSDQRTLANAELRKRPLKDRDKRKYKNTVPPPPSNPNVQGIVNRSINPAAQNVAGGQEMAATYERLAQTARQADEAAMDLGELGFMQRGAEATGDRTSLDARMAQVRYTQLRKSYEEGSTAEGRAALDDGYFSSDESFLINETLRSGGEATDVIRGLQSAAREWSLGAPVTAYRGMWDLGLSDESLVGSVWEDAGFQSTTLDRNRAFTWASSRGDDVVMLDVVIPRGTRAAVGHDQMEVLIPDGAELRVVKDQVEEIAGRKVRVLKCYVENVE